MRTVHWGAVHWEIVLSETVHGRAGGLMMIMMMIITTIITMMIMTVMIIMITMIMGKKMMMLDDAFALSCSRQLSSLEASPEDQKGRTADGL